MSKPRSMLLRLLIEAAQHTGVRIAAAAGVLAVIGLGIYAWQSGVTLSQLKDFGTASIAFLGAHPMLLFAAIAILPIIPVPVSALLILAGVVYIPIMGIPLACGLTITAMTINLMLAYWIAAFPGRQLVESLLKKAEYSLPALNHGDQFKLALIMRITPGVPFLFQNFASGLLRMPMKIYIPVSVVVVGFYTCAFMITGGALFTGNAGRAILGISLIIVLTAVTGLIRKKLANKSKAVPIEALAKE